MYIVCLEYEGSNAVASQKGKVTLAYLAEIISKVQKVEINPMEEAIPGKR